MKRRCQMNILQLKRTTDRQVSTYSRRVCAHLTDWCRYNDEGLHLQFVVKISKMGGDCCIQLSQALLCRSVPTTHIAEDTSLWVQNVKL